MASPQRAEMLARFQQQMADVARADLLKRLRKDRHWSQERAAQEIGVSVRSIRSWERGGGIKWRNARRLAEAYGVEPEQITRRDDDEDEGEVSEAPEEEVGLEAKVDLLLAQQARLLAEVGKVQAALRVPPAPRQRPAPHSESADI